MSDLDILQTSLGPRYRLERELGRGGWATVYLAVDRKHERPVAIKVFHPELALTLGTERFLQEIRLVAQFQHPYILPLHDSGETADAPYYVMPYVEGESLRQRLERVKRLGVREAVEIARDVAGALEYAHERGVVHRDIKPENVLLTGGHALVADFGIAIAIRAATGEMNARDGARTTPTAAARISRPGLAVGTPAYMSPEQALGTVEPDRRSDIYSLGVVVYEMLAGATPYPEISLQSVVNRHLRVERLTPLDEVRPDVPREVSDAVQRALAVEPGERFATAREFADALAAGLPLERRPRGRRIALAAGAVALLGAAALGLWRWREARTAGAVSPTAVAVFPFSVRGAREYGYLGTGMVDLLSTDLDGAGELRGVDAHAVLGSLGASPGPVTPARARELAGRLGAGLYVLGTVFESGGTLRIQAALYDRAHPGSPVATASVDGAADRLFDLVDGLATELLAERPGGPGGRLTRIAAVTTRSLPALKAYLEGEEQIRAGRYDSAMLAFDRATAADSQFALAYYRRAVSANWNADFDEARESAALAIRHGSHLSDDDRALLEAFLAWDRGSPAEAERLYRGVLRGHPDNVEAWYNLGEVLFHYDALRGGTMKRARPAFERALALDPQMSDARLHLIDIAAREGRLADFDTLLSGLPEGPLRVRRAAVLAFARGPRAARDSALARLRASNDATVILTIWMTATYLEDLATAERTATLLLAPERAAETQAYGRLLLAQLALGQGRWRDAGRQLDAAAAVDSTLALEYRALLAVAPFVPAEPDTLRALGRRLASWDAGAEPPVTGSTGALRVHNGVHPLLRHYLLGVIAARLGDAPEVARAEGELRRAAQAQLAPAAPAADSLARSLAADLAAGVRAHADWYGGRAAAALAAVERLRTQAPVEKVANSPFYSHEPERFLRAEALHALGRDAEAAPFYASLEEGRFDAIYLAPTHLRLAEIADRAGDRATAAFHYGRVVDLWADADPELRVVVARARARRDELRKE